MILTTRTHDIPRRPNVRDYRARQVRAIEISVGKSAAYAGIRRARVGARLVDHPSFQKLRCYPPVTVDQLDHPRAGDARLNRQDGPVGNRSGYGFEVAGHGPNSFSRSGRVNFSSSSGASAWRAGQSTHQPTQRPQPRGEVQERARRRQPGGDHEVAMTPSHTIMCQSRQGAFASRRVSNKTALEVQASGKLAPNSTSKPSFTPPNPSTHDYWGGFGFSASCTCPNSRIHDHCESALTTVRA